MPCWPPASARPGLIAGPLCALETLLIIPRCISCCVAGQPQQQIAGGPFGVKFEHHQLPAVPPLELHGFSQSPAQQRQQRLQTDTAGGKGVPAATS